MGPYYHYIFSLSFFILPAVNSTKLMRVSCILIAILFNLSANAREGMWLPQLLSSLNEPDMKSMGMQITAEDIYSIKQSSLKDAVLQFGGGCTGELISGSGLLITNHHCGFSQIQSLSTIEKNYLENGFWAKDFKEELPCPGLTVTFIRDITDVTKIILSGISDTTNEDIRGILVKERSDSLEKTLGAKLKGLVRSFYQGNKFYLFTLEVYSDIRFVGAPPQDIGKFGGETDNWVWPRHTGDFSLFRIYANKENQPSAYSADNVPYQPKKFLNINIGGVKEKDFIFVFGFPGRTNEYLISSGLETIVEQTNPNRIAIRDIRLDQMRDAMRANDTINLQYASKFSTLENAYKKWKGELIGFEKNDVVSKKLEAENSFKQLLLNSGNVSADTSLFTRYNSINEQANPLNYAIDYYTEGFSGVELLNATARFNKLIDVFSDTSKTQKDREAEIKKCKTDFRNFYKNYNVELDKRICEKILAYATRKVSKDYLPDLINKNSNKNDNDFIKYTEQLYSHSLVADSNRVMAFLNSFGKKHFNKIKKDPAYLLMNDIAQNQQAIQIQLTALNKQLSAIQREYLADMLQIEKTKKLFPDANSTLRVSYGRVEGVMPQDGVEYKFYTTTDGLLRKSEMDVFDYKIPEKLKELIRAKDYGRYGKNGVLNVAFLSSAHTTGGNSGSPVLNAKGELVGVNFDRMWEGVLSDYYYDESLCRNICLDIRFALFVIEKYGKATRLIEEMKIVQN